MGICNRQIFSSLLISVLVIGFASNLSLGHESQHFGSSTMPVLEDSLGHSHCGHEHHHHHHKHHYHHEERFLSEKKLPEELAEEEDLKLYGFGAQHGHHHYHDNDDGNGASELSGVGLWIHAMGCSLLVSLASLICLMILPLIFMGGKPSKTFVDSLALFGAGAMLGDAFLHQLPHTFGGGQSHSHDHHEGHVHIPADPGQHAHSIEDLSAGLSILAGILFFLLIEKLVRYVEELFGGDNAWPHVHHHHRTSKKLKDDEDATENLQDHSSADKNGGILNPPSDDQLLDEISNNSLQGKEQSAPAILRKRNSITSFTEDKPGVDAANGFTGGTESAIQKEIAPSANLVFGYLNLFSDGVHNFTDGMALGSAFLLYGSVGGWSRTVFLLAHELPQEIGDFGILVRSGFSVSKALAFNFLSALMALVGTALALAGGEDPGQSSLIEGFTAGGFIYIAVAGVLAEMNNSSSSLKSTAIQVTSLIVGMTIALCISLVE